MEIVKTVGHLAMSKNDITGDDIKSKVSVSYRDNWDAIWGSKKPAPGNVCEDCGKVCWFVQKGSCQDYVGCTDRSEINAKGE